MLSCLLDDIVVYSDEFNLHLTHLTSVFDCLVKNGFQLKAKKCQFLRKSIHYLGHVVGNGQIRPNPDKIKAIQDMPHPISKDEMLSFLGLISYYGRFVPQKADIIEPLQKLVRKNVVFYWSLEAQRSFDILKDILSREPVLRMPDFKRTFYLCTDASNVGLSAILEQRGDDNAPYVIQYASRPLKRAERNYNTTEKECLALVFGIGTFTPYLQGRKFVVLTDHSALQWLKSAEHKNQMLNRWAILVSGFDFDIAHRKGKDNANADALSRLPIVSVVVVAVAATPNFFRSEEIVKRIAVEQRHDPYTRKIIAYLQTSEIPDNPKDAKLVVRESRFMHLDEDGRLFSLWWSGTGKNRQTRLRLVVPSKMRESVMERFHADKFEGAHLGVEKTFSKLRLRFYWSTMRKDVENWIKGCKVCQQKKHVQKLGAGHLQPIPVSYPWEYIAVDFAGPLTLSHRGNRYIMVATCLFTKWAEAWAIPAITAEVSAKILTEQMFCRFGLPDVLLTDQGSQFTSAVTKEVCKLLAIDKLFTTAYHPQTNGQTEKFNRTLKTMLRTLIQDRHQKDWDEFIPYILMAYRAAPHKSTNDSPYYLVFGREPRLPLDVSLHLPADEKQGITEYKSSVTQRIARGIKLAQRALEKARQQYEKHYNTGRSPLEFSVGDSVWLYIPHISKGLSKKFSSPWCGPFRIAQKISPLLYELGRGNGKLTQRVHIDRLKPFYDRISKPEGVVRLSKTDKFEADMEEASYVFQDVLVQQPDSSSSGNESRAEPVTEQTLDDANSVNPVPSTASLVEEEEGNGPVDLESAVNDADGSDDDDDYLNLESLLESTEDTQSSSPLIPAWKSGVFEIEKILSHRQAAPPRGGLEYLVRWKDWSEEFDEWKHESDISAERLEKEYWNRIKKTKPKPKKIPKKKMAKSSATSTSSDG
jgi:transposase InsO family protein